MTMLNLGPIGMAAMVPLGGDESNVTIKRWVLKLLLPSFLLFFGFMYSVIDTRFVKLETAPSNAQQIDRLDQRMKNIEKLIDLYESLRITREKQITELQTDRKNMERKLDDLSAKIDRVLYRLRP